MNGGRWTVGYVYLWMMDGQGRWYVNHSRKGTARNGAVTVTCKNQKIYCKYSFIYWNINWDLIKSTNLFKMTNLISWSTILIFPNIKKSYRYWKTNYRNNKTLIPVYNRKEITLIIKLKKYSDYVIRTLIYLKMRNEEWKSF